MNNLLWPFCLSLLFKGYIDQCFTDCDLQSVVGCLFKLFLLSLCTVFLYLLYATVSFQKPKITALFFFYEDTVIADWL